MPYLQKNQLNDKFFIPVFLFHLQPPLPTPDSEIYGSRQILGQSADISGQLYGNRIINTGFAVGLRYRIDLAYGSPEGSMIRNFHRHTFSYGNGRDIRLVHRRCHRHRFRIAVSQYHTVS